MIPARLRLERVDALLASLAAGDTEVGQDQNLAEIGRLNLLLLEGRKNNVKGCNDFFGDFVASELGEEFLLGRQVEILVVDNLVPDALGVDEKPSAGMRRWYSGRKMPPWSSSSPWVPLAPDRCAGEKRAPSFLTSSVNLSACRILCGKAAKPKSK